MNITASFHRRRALEFFAAAWLWVEAGLRWLAPVFALILVVANLAFWGLLGALPATIQFIAALLFWFGGIYLLVREFPHVAWPNAARIKARLEQAGNLPHQPLQTLADEPIRRSPLADALWQQHKMQAAGLLAQLRWPILRAGYAPRDPFALRWLLILLALLGILHAPKLALPRLLTAFAPTSTNILATLGAGKVYLYFVPPAYSGIAPIYLTSTAPLPKKLTLPQGTMLWARVAGGAVKPVLTLTDEKKFSRLQDNFFVLQTKLDTGDVLQIRQGFVPLLNLPLKIQSPRPPEVTLDQITLMPHGEMQIKLCARDLYALRSLTLHWRGSDRPDILGEKNIPVKGKNLCQDVIVNFAADILAGRPARLWASAVNSAGLERDSEIKNLPLPHEEFQNPVAADLAAARQDYALNNDAGKLAQALKNLNTKSLPVGLFLSVQNVQQQLNSHDAAIQPAILANLWQIIMRLEEGEYADIAANWRLAQGELLDDLRNWQVPEADVLKSAARAAVAWHDYAPLHGEDPEAYEKVWQYIALWINNGQRDAAAAIIARLDQSPRAVLEQINTIPQNTDTDNANALRILRARLDNASLDADEKNYLKRLIVPGLEIQPPESKQPE
jgi:hypothetical protein